jgi:hypothetical protein
MTLDMVNANLGYPADAFIEPAAPGCIHRPIRRWREAR